MNINDYMSLSKVRLQNSYELLCDAKNYWKINHTNQLTTERRTNKNRF